MNQYSDPVAALRAHVKDMQQQAEKMRGESREDDLIASAIFGQSIQLDLIIDKIEGAKEPRA